jgi:hypothetical protein
MPKFRATIAIEVDIEADDMTHASEIMEFQYPYNDVLNIKEIEVTNADL